MYTGVEVSRAEASHYVESRGVGVQSVLEQQTLLMKLARCSLRRDVLRMRERDVHDRYSVPTRPSVSRQTKSISRLITISVARPRLVQSSSYSAVFRPPGLVQKSPRSMIGGGLSTVRSPKPVCVLSAADQTEREPIAATRLMLPHRAS